MENFSLLRKKIIYYLQLTKPSIMLLVIITGASSLFMEGSLVSQPLRFFLVLLALYLTGGSANALNQYFERDLDSIMDRTKNRRPLPLGRIPAANAFIFSVVIGIIGILMFGFIFNWLTAILSLTTILFYSLVYTLYLKPNTKSNIVIGGIAGAMAPVGAWTAATDKFALAPIILFLIIFLWTPPHFWSLASFREGDYKKSGLPMLPVVKGVDFTMNQILIYIIVLVIVTISLFSVYTSWIYLGVAIVAGYIFLKKSYKAKKDPSVKRLKGLFGFSILYLFAIFFTIIIESSFHYLI